MRIKFWGTRGSIPTPGPQTVRYGGNTPCVELRTTNGTLIVIDCGTGAHALGRSLMQHNKQALAGHLLIGHTHWDHIQGIPFFEPLFSPKSKWSIYGPRGVNVSIRDALEGQMQHTYFPIVLGQFSANIDYHDIVEGSFNIDDIKVTVCYLNHTCLTCGFRIEADGVTVVYACDHEPFSRVAATNPQSFEGHDRLHADFLADADLVIHDAQYTAEEYPKKIGWGHSTIEYAVKICQSAGVKQLALTHHDPLRSDDDLDAIVRKTGLELKQNASVLTVIAAAEGQEIELTPSTEQKTKQKTAVKTAPASAIFESKILLCISDEKMAESLAEVCQDEAGTTVVTTVAEAQQYMLATHPTLVIAQHKLPKFDALGLCRAIRHEPRDKKNPIPLIVITDKEIPMGDDTASITDWLLEPFSPSYARAKIHAWLLRTALRWEVAKIPVNETQRVASLRRLGILDTDPEERFDRIARIAAAVFNTPIAMITFVDANRQWFKSCIGIDEHETPREASICAHAVYSQKTLIVPDTLNDDRFADNPLVVDEPRLRFYAGSPLILKDGTCPGTLCVLDTRPHVLDDEDVQYLEDLRDMVVEILEG